MSELRDKIGERLRNCAWPWPPSEADAILSLIRAEVEKLERHEMFEEDLTPDYIKFSDVLALLEAKA